jgi:serine phosphatase RsbU (regulator of sigma subunit)
VTGFGDENIDPYREFNLLYRVGETMGETLDPGAVPDIVLEESCRVIENDLAAVILFDGADWQVAATCGPAEAADLYDLIAYCVAAYRDSANPVMIAELPGSTPAYSALLWAPLVAAENKLGGILLGRQAGESVFTPAEERLLAALARQTAVALNNARLFQEIRIYTQHLRELSLITREISSSLDVETVLERILDSAHDLSDAVAGTLFLVEGPQGDLVFRVVKGNQTDLTGRRLPAGTGIVGHVADTGQAQIVNRVDTSERWFQEVDTSIGFKTQSIVAVPLLKDNVSIGVLELVNKRDASNFHARDVALLETLAGQAVVALENARLHQEELVKQRMEQELRLGFEMQSSLIPASVPALDGWEFAAWWQPAREVSGDYYDFIPLAKQQGVVIADVADKGVHAALFMALTRSIVRASITALHEPAEALRRANHLIAADATDGMFVTLCYAQFDTAGRVTYVNAGHNPPLWYRAEVGAFLELTRTGIVLGLESDEPLEQKTIVTAPGDLLLLYTDGVTEAMNPLGEMFGRARLVEVLRAHHHSSAQDIRDGILSALNLFIEDTPQSDDVTLVIARRV